MPLIVAASTNPVKIEATLRGFRRMFPDEDFTIRIAAAPSGVSEQPMSDDETLQGARNRAEGAKKLYPDADYWVGIEGGVDEHGGELLAFAWVVILGQERVGKSRTATFTLPTEVAALVRQGVELGHADDRIFGRVNSKHTNGAIGLLTGDVIDRAAYYEHAVILALVPFRNSGLSFGE